MKQSNVLNLIHLYQANVDCLTTCRIEMKNILPDSELLKVRDMQRGKLTSIKLFDGQDKKADADLSPEELFQMHLVSLADKLN